MQTKAEDIGGEFAECIKSSHNENKRPYRTIHRSYNLSRGYMKAHDRMDERTFDMEVTPERARRIRELLIRLWKDQHQYGGKENDGETGGDVSE